MSRPWDFWILPFAILSGSTVVLILVRAFFFRLLRQKSAKVPLLDGVLIRAIATPSYLWCVAGGFLIAIDYAELPPRAERMLQHLVQITLIFSITWTSANIAVQATQRALRRIESPMASSGVVKSLLQFVIFAVGILVICTQLGISIAPMLTAFGIAGAAVAIALKDTLENLFAGFNLLMDRAIRVGDSIMLVEFERFQPGTVEDIGWRTTRVKLDAGGGTIILPNSKLANSIIRKK